MDWSYIIFAAAIILLIWIWMRNRNKETPRLQAAIGTISTVNDNIKILEIRRTEPHSPKKFKTGRWQSCQDHMDFLDPETVTALKDSFTIIADFNAKIEAAKKSDSLATLQELPLDKLKDPLYKSKQGLVVWLKANLQTEIKTRKGMFGF
jgi:hypothetical protein